MFSRTMKFIMFTFIMVSAIGVIFAQDTDWIGLPVVQIKIVGMKTGGEKDVLDLIALREGYPITEESLNKSLKTLFGLDRFANVEVDVTTTRAKDGVIVTFTVTENIYIKKIIFEGNRKVGREDLLDVITLSEESHFTKLGLENSTNNILRKYREEGFIDAKVEYNLDKLKDHKTKQEISDQYELTFKVTESNKVVVEKIVTEGANEVPARDIKGVMKTKERVFILQSGVLKREDFQEDKKRIIALYGQKGFLDAKVVQYEWKTEMLPGRRPKDAPHKAIVVYIKIEEGEKYYVGKITVKGNTIFPADKLSDMVMLKEDEVYDKMKMELARYNIYNAYSDNGHLYANVSMLTSPYIEDSRLIEVKTNRIISTNKNLITTNRVVVTNIAGRVETNHLKINTEFVIYEGPRAHIEDVTISGNTKTLSQVIKRELLFNEGELYIQKKVRQSYERLMQLQYFKEINFVPTPGSSEGLIGIDIAVEEQRTGLVTFGIGYGTESGINGTGQVTEKNLFGTGRSLGFKGEYGQTRQLLELSFQEPWLFNTPTSAGIALSYSQYLYDNIAADDNGDGIIDGTNINYISDPTASLDDYESTNRYYKENISLGLSLSRRLGIYGYTRGSWSFTKYRNHSATFSVPLIYGTSWSTNTDLIDSLNRGYITKISLGVGFGWDSTDSPLNPLKGSQFSADLYYNGGLFGGDIHYLRPKLSFSAYWNPFWKFVLAFHASTEFMLPQFQLDKTQDRLFEYDTSDMLWFDGVYEMRGWQYYTARGESKLFCSGELRFQIYGQELWGLMFFDIGNLWDKYNLWSFDPSGYLCSFGIGIKINIPMLPIRLYLARKGYYDSDMSKWQMTSSQQFFDDWKVVFSIQGLF